MLALAHTMQALLGNRSVRDQRELAELMGLTRARVTQLLDLTLLAPDIQEEVLTVEVGSAKSEPVSARELIALVRCSSWHQQRRR